MAKIVFDLGALARRRPKKPKCFWFLVLRRVDMAQATVTANWTPSASAGVSKQLLQVTVNGQAQPLQTLQPAVTTFTFTAGEKDVIHAELWCSDGVLDSSHAVADLTIPEITAPSAPTGFGLTWTEAAPTPTPAPVPTPAKVGAGR